jgi:hypothetical protein
LRRDDGEALDHDGDRATGGLVRFLGYVGGGPKHELLAAADAFGPSD